MYRADDAWRYLAAIGVQDDAVMAVAVRVALFQEGDLLVGVRRLAVLMGGEAGRCGVHSHVEEGPQQRPVFVDDAHF